MNKKSDARRAFIDGRDVDSRSTGQQIQPNIPNARIQEVDMDGTDSIEEMFRNDINNNQNDIKELFHEDKVKTRTDISARQVKLITKAHYLAQIVGMKEIDEILLEFMKLRISDSRKSRAEFVDGLKAKIENQIQQGAMNVRGQFGK